MKRVNLSGHAAVPAVAVEATAPQKSIKETVSELWKKATAFMVVVFMFSSAYAQDVASDIEELFEDQIKPIANVIVGIGIFIAAIYAGILFFQGKKEGMKNVGFILAGALVIKFVAVIAESILVD